jgi:hypothetical protein
VHQSRAGKDPRPERPAQTLPGDVQRDRCLQKQIPHLGNGKGFVLDWPGALNRNLGGAT